MKITTIWVVTDPSPSSSMEDICWKAALGPGTGLSRIDYVIRGSEPDAMIRERWAFFTEEAEARADAERRLSAR